MRPHSFVLSWGRKMFFGQGWPLLSLVALSYLQGGIIPTSPSGIFYYLVTHVSHYGLLTAILYFVFFMPLARLFPNYYFARIWCLFLLVGSGLLIFIDATVFTLYRFHFNTFVWDLVVDGGLGDLFQVKPSFYIISATLAFSAMAYLWFRGEWLWRGMQRRFSNPNANWYLVLIGILVLLGKGLYVYADGHGVSSITRIGQVFPLYFTPSGEKIFGEGEKTLKVGPGAGKSRDFGYPAEKMNCPSGDNMNFLMVTVDGWSPAELNEFETPLLWHYVQHGQYFTNHFSSGTTPGVGLFSLFYGLPGVHMKGAKHDEVSPVFLQELMSRGYELGVFTDHNLDRDFVDRTVFVRGPELTVSANVNEDYRSWLEKHLSKGEERPFFALVSLGGTGGIDTKISEMVEGLHAKGLTNETIVIIAGTNGESVPHMLRVPLLIIWPGKSSDKFTGMTWHYDVAPTVMKELWNCQNSYEAFSDGRSLFDEGPRSSYVLGDESQYEILDFTKEQIVTVNPLKGYAVKDFGLRELPRTKANKDLILSVLRHESRFRKKVKF